MRLLVGLAASLTVAGAVLGLVTACGGNAFVATAGPGDASSLDAGAQEASGAPSFCAIEGGAATFCDDFDVYPLVAPGRWAMLDQTPGATIQKDTSAFVSSPDSLESITPVPSGIGTQRGRLEKTLGSASKITLSFEVRIDTVAPKPLVGGTSFVLFELGANTIGLSANTNQVSYFEDQIVDGGGDTNLITGDVLPTSAIQGSWISVVVEIDVKNASFTCVVNGTTVGPVPITLPAGAGAAPELFLGIQARGVTAQLEAHYDNVLVNVTP